MNERGFTLLEMVVTVFIFGFIGVLAVQLLSQSVQVSGKVIARGSVVSEWHRGLNVMEHDLSQLIHRPVRDEFGDVTPSVVLENEAVIEFTRTGWLNPLRRQRSELQRVVYFFTDRTLYRRYWTVLDRVYDSPPVDQVLLQDVSQVRFEIWDTQGNVHSFWPSLSARGEQIPIGEVAMVSLYVQSPQFGQVVKHWVVPTMPELMGTGANNA